MTPEEIEKQESEYADYAEIIVELESNLDKAVQALKALVNRLHEIHADEHYKSVWHSYANHGGDYSDGPTYTKELAAADALLAKSIANGSRY